MNGSNQAIQYGRTSSPATRFHHRVLAPATMEGLAVQLASPPKTARPVSHIQGWTLRKGSDPVFQAIVAEYGSPEAAQRYAWLDIDTISAPIDRTATTQGPGDYAIANIVTRDNVHLSGGWPGHVLANTQRTLGGLDAYLLKNWPQEVARKLPQPLVPLSIALTAASRVKRGEATKLAIVVLADGHPVPLFDLSFRILADPGVVVLQDGALWFSCAYPGRATITLDALGPSPPAGYGQSSTVIQVEP